MNAYSTPPGPPPNNRAGMGEAADYYQGYVPPPPYLPPSAAGGKDEYSFEDKFVVNKPKYNDIWAGILVCKSSLCLYFIWNTDCNCAKFILDILGFAAVSALSVRGYTTTRTIQGMR